MVAIFRDPYGTKSDAKVRNIWQICKFFAKKSLFRHFFDLFFALVSLIFQAEDKAQGVQVFYHDENIWATQKAMAELYGIDKSGISRHLANIYESGELSPEMTVAKFATVVNRGIRGEVTEEIDFYNLDAIISVGYRVNSIRATQFRRWATSVLRQFAIKGYVLDRKRMENGAFLSEKYCYIPETSRMVAF